MESQQAYSDRWETEVIANLLLPNSVQHRTTASTSYLVSQSAKNLPENDLAAYKSTSVLSWGTASAALLIRSEVKLVAYH